jgi:hypothetical protein
MRPVTALPSPPPIPPPNPLVIDDTVCLDEGTIHPAQTLAAIAKYREGKEQ